MATGLQRLDSSVLSVVHLWAGKTRDLIMPGCWKRGYAVPGLWNALASRAHQFQSCNVNYILYMYTVIIYNRIIYNYIYICTILYHIISDFISK